MRRAQSVRHHARPSLALGADELGALREGDESNEDILRRQLIDKDRENDKLQTQVQILQAQLAQRPPLERVQELEKEYKNLDLLLQGTQRENERCMAELERCKAREKMLERELTKLVGEDWQSAVDISLTPSSLGTRPAGAHHRSNTISSHRTSTPDSGEPSTQASVSHIEQVRLLILGMEQRSQAREEKLMQCVQTAEGEAARFENMTKEILANRPSRPVRNGPGQIG